LADIRHSVEIGVPPEQVYPLSNSASGFSKWWAEDVTQHSDGTVDLGFFNRATVYTLRSIKAAAPLRAEWLCLNGEEWKDTTMLFDLSNTDGQTLLQFTHAHWAETDYFVSCNTTWGALMFRLKSAAENKMAVPLFSKSGWAR